MVLFTYFDVNTQISKNMKENVQNKYTKIHKYTTTQLHKYTNTQIHKYKYTNTNTQIQIHIITMITL